MLFEINGKSFIYIGLLYFIIILCKMTKCRFLVTELLSEWNRTFDAFRDFGTLFSVDDFIIKNRIHIFMSSIHWFCWA